MPAENALNAKELSTSNVKPVDKLGTGTLSVMKVIANPLISKKKIPKKVAPVLLTSNSKQLRQLAADTEIVKLNSKKVRTSPKKALKKTQVESKDPSKESQPSLLLEKPSLSLDVGLEGDIEKGKNVKIKIQFLFVTLS